MNKKKFKLQEQLNRIIEMSDGNPVSGKHLVVVDIQPEYEKGIHFLYGFINFLNDNYGSLSRLTFLYNGHDTLGMINESDYKWWWIENGLDMEIVDNSVFYDKGYAFFRYCMDNSIDEGNISNLIRFMINKGINDSREMDTNFWDEFIGEYGDEEIRELMEFADDCINIPDLMDELSDYRGIVLCGGGINECLKEVEIALDALDMDYSVLTKYTY